MMGMHDERALCFSVLVAVGHRSRVTYALSKPHYRVCWSKLLGS